MIVRAVGIILIIILAICIESLCKVFNEFAESDKRRSAISCGIMSEIILLMWTAIEIVMG